MDIVIIGTGNTATVLGRKLKEAGHRVVQVYGRDSKAASKLAYDLGTESTNYWNVVNRDADIYIVAVSDIAIKEILAELRLPDKTIVHTAASVSKNILKNSATHFGVFYPLQSLIKETAERLDYISPAQSQTGPALRHDSDTIKRHLELLKKYPHLKKIYETFTESIFTTH